MEPRAHHVLIGLFTLVAAAAMIGFALWMAKAHQQGQVSYYDVVFNEPVRGLSRGGAVLYNGIRVGEVKTLRLDPSDVRIVRAQIAIDASIPVHADTRAGLVLTGITGVSVIELSGGSPTSPLLMANEDDVPVIIATPSPLSQLLAGSDNLLTNISELVLSAKGILSPDNVAHFSNTLANLDVVMASFADGRDSIKALTAKVSDVTLQLGDTLGHVNALLDTSNTLVAEQGVATFEHARQAMTSLNRASAAMAKLINDNAAGVTAGVHGLAELGPALQALRQTLISIQTVSQNFDESPSRYLLGRDKVQEFEP